MEIENEYLFNAELENGINLFLGSGFSTLASDTDGKGLPTGSTLAKELTEYFKLPPNLDLPQLCKIAKKKNRDGLREFFEKRFTVYSFDERYETIPQINVHKIFTTNIDDLLYKIYSKSSEHYLNDLDIRGASHGDRLAIDIVCLHGNVTNKNRDFTFTPQEISSAFRSDPDRWHVLTEAMQKNRPFFGVIA